MTATPMTQFAAWWAETDRLLKAQGLKALTFFEARDWHECEIEPETAVELVAANVKWAQERARKHAK
jgi:hypothetical protein